MSRQTTQSNNISHSEAILLDKGSPSTTQDESIIGASVEQSDSSFLLKVGNDNRFLIWLVPNRLVHGLRGRSFQGLS